MKLVKHTCLHATLAQAFWLISCGDPSIDDDNVDEAEVASQEQAVINGRTTNARPEVGILNVGGGLGCSLVMISPRVFLTAAHCVASEAQVSDPNFYDVVLNNPNDGTPWESKVETIRSLSGDGKTGKFDVAVGRLSTAVPSWVTPATLSPISQVNGNQVTLIGYGCTTFGTSNGVGGKRYSTFNWNSTSSTGQGCGGDSGGGLFLGSLTSPGGLVGIQSGGDGAKSSYGDVPFFKERIEAVVRSFDSSVEANWDRFGMDYKTVTVTGGPSLCMQQCTVDPVCRAFTWIAASNACKLKKAVPHPTPKTDVVSGLPARFGHFTITGTTLSASTAASRDLCETSCAQNVSCTGFTSNGTSCKTYQGTLATSITTNTAVWSGMRRVVESGIGRSGTSLASFTASSAVMCAMLCNGNPNDCRSWTWTASNQSCALWKQVSGPVVQSGVSSGVHRTFDYDTKITNVAAFQSTTMTTPEPARCESLCQSGMCWGWTLDSQKGGSNKCSLYQFGTTAPGTSSARGIISGMRDVGSM